MTKRNFAKEIHDVTQNDLVAYVGLSAVIALYELLCFGYHVKVIKL